MKDFLKQYKGKLTVRGPVFVGSGKEMGKKEYLFLPGNRVGILDIGKVHLLMGKKGRLRQFEEFMMGGFADIGRWLEQQRLLQEVERSCLAYVLDRGNTALERGQRTQIMACMKDAQGKPYIPGSTLKGMFRSILATDKLLQDTAIRKAAQQDLERELPQDRSRTQYLSAVSQRLEGRLFRTLAREGTRPADAVNDIMSGFIVSDSEPIEVKQLVLAQKVEYRPDGTDKKLNLLRESLCPGTEIRFTISVDHSICPITKESLLQAVERFDEAYSDNFLQAFHGTDRLRPPQVFVGGGTGFLSKTVVYPIMGKKSGVAATATIFDKTRVPRQHKHWKDKELGVSPHILKCTRYKGKTLQMGLCDLSLI